MLRIFWESMQMHIIRRCVVPNRILLQSLYLNMFYQGFCLCKPEGRTAWSLNFLWTSVRLQHSDPQARWFNHFWVVGKAYIFGWTKTINNISKTYPFEVLHSICECWRRVIVRCLEMASCKLRKLDHLLWSVDQQRSKDGRIAVHERPKEELSNLGNAFWMVHVMLILMEQEVIVCCIVYMCIHNVI